MPSALPVDLRERVVTAIDAGASRREPARPFAVGRADGRRSTLVRHRSAARTVPAQIACPAGGTWPAGRGEQPVPLLQAPRYHASKNTGHAGEQRREDVKAARRASFVGQLDIDPDRLEFFGETAAALKMARCYGRAPCGERCRLAVPFGPLLQLHQDLLQSAAPPLGARLPIARRPRADDRVRTANKHLLRQIL